MFNARQFVLTGQGEARTLTAGMLGEGFLRILRVQPAIGRDFRPEEGEPGRAQVVIVSDRFWRMQLGAHTNVIGEHLMLNDQAHTIVGVMPPSFAVRAWGLTTRDIFVPLALTSAGRAVREDTISRRLRGSRLASPCRRPSPSSR